MPSSVLSIDSRRWSATAVFGAWRRILLYSNFSNDCRIAGTALLAVHAVGSTMDSTASVRYDFPSKFYTFLAQNYMKMASKFYGKNFWPIICIQCLNWNFMFLAGCSLWRKRIAHCRSVLHSLPDPSLLGMLGKDSRHANSRQTSTSAFVWKAEGET